MNSVSSRRGMRCLQVVLLVCAAGCGGAVDSIEFADATGVVTYQSKPVSGATVMAYPEKGPVATGTTDAEGRFTLSSGSDQPGVALGPVRVAVTKRASSDAAPVPEGTTPSGEEFVDPTKAMEAMRTQQEASREGNAPSTPESEIPAQYASPETSGLTFEIKAGDNDLPITLQ